LADGGVDRPVKLDQVERLEETSRGSDFFRVRRMAADPALVVLPGVSVRVQHRRFQVR
jgi:hypothetical protein